jgi:hypothetical protein
LDTVQVNARRITEEKSFLELNPINPRTGPPYNSHPAETIQQQVYEAAVKKIDSIAVARSTSFGRELLDAIRGMRTFIFRIEADTEQVRALVTGQLARLRAKYPDWMMDAELGVSQTPP